VGAGRRLARVLPCWSSTCTGTTATGPGRPPPLGYLILVADGLYSGWRRRAALAYNLASASTVLVGAVAAYALAAQVQVAVLLAFAAGNFLYIALADLVPELTTSPAPHDKAIHTAGFALGLLLLLLVALLD
jgi:zinc transporter ZupT